MNWLDAKYAEERRDEQVREMQRQEEIARLVSQAKPKRKPRQVRRTVGSKLVQLGERLQDSQPAPRPSASKSSA